MVDRLMRFKQLFRGLQHYNKQYPHWVESYQLLRERGYKYWTHLEMLDEGQIRGQVIGSFLNEWLCSVSYESAASLKQAVGKLSPFYLALKNETIENIRFDAEKNVKEKTLSNAEIIKEIMRCFLRVRPKFGSVPASKLMHMAIPTLFVMWDTGIKKKHRIPTYYYSDQAEWYVRFLKLTKVQINHAINDFMKVNAVDRQRAIQQIRARDGNLTLARIVDKYNFAVRDNAVDICDKCFTYWRNMILEE